MAVADVLISKVLDSLISLATTEIEQKFKLVAGVESEVKMLTANLESIQAVMIDAEKRQLKQEAVKLWVYRLKLISYDIDNVLDEWSTEILKSKIEGDHTLKRRSKVWSFILSSCFCFTQVGFRHDIAVKIRELNGSLDVIAKEKERYGFQQIQWSEQVQRLITTSIVNISEVKGREHDKNVVMDLLFVESKQNPHVISLIGMGGIGKTTLAKLVYNEDRVMSNFGIRIWVCVSDPFDEIRIAKAILESFEKQTTQNLVEKQTIVECIQQYIVGKKFLLVLDDVWNEDAQKWEQVNDFLKCGSPGSKILVTTRKENVARQMGCRPRDIIKLGLLSNEECWSIFSQVVYPEGNNEMQNNSFEAIGRKIVEKCKGLPLSVKTIGGLLRFKESIEEWRRVLDSELWELEEVETEVFAPLRLSYDDLSPSLKQCFLYCAIFPKDYVINKRDLIAMWASQGYIRRTQNKDIEVIGDEHFRNIAMRSFFQDFDFDESVESITGFKMHDVVHDFTQSLVMKKEYCSIEVNNLEELMIDLNDNKIFHVAVVLRKGVSFPSSFCTLEKLRTLVVLPDDNLKIEGSLADVFNQLTCLRSLSLSGCDIEEVPPNISKLVHLRQLDLSHNGRLKEFPETICKLYNLETLDVGWCYLLKSLPQEIGKVVNLRFLYNDECKFLLPKELGKLSRLQRLSRIEVDHNEREALLFGDLRNLNKLGGSLEISWRRQVRDVDVRDAEEGVLKEKKNLYHLTLSFSDVYGEEGTEEELIEALEAPPNLKYLDIDYYQGTKSPSWISSLACLKRVHLSEWTYCEELPPLGKLFSLEYLRIGSFNSIERVGKEFLGMNKSKNVASSITTIAFPKLIDLMFGSMGNWEEWNEEDDDDGINKEQRNNGEEEEGNNGEEEGNNGEEEEEEEEEGNNGEEEEEEEEEEGTITRQIMPCLRSLTLLDCPNLKALPSYILHNTSLKLVIDQCDVLEGLR